VRVDAGIRSGSIVATDYDPMLAKVIAYGDDRSAAIRALDKALADTAVLGVTTNIEFLRFLLSDPDVVAGRLDTGLLDRRTPDFAAVEPGDRELIAAAAYRWLCAWAAGGPDLWAVPSGWRMGERSPFTVRLHSGERTEHVHLTGAPEKATAVVEDGESHSVTASLTGGRLGVTVDGLHTEYLVADTDGQIWLSGAGSTAVVEEVREAPVRPEAEHSGDAELASPMPGAVVAVGVSDGHTVDAGTMVVTVEAMKMEHALTSPVHGVVELLVAVGDQVKVGQPLARITASNEEES
jgi:acetyl-CoA/propionyl-CoA carboxylase biotin carboxyl carrier protein